MPESILSLRDVDFCYPSAPASVIRSLSVTFPRGFTGIAGPNGVGKTTLLQLATGLLQPTGGSIDFLTNSMYCAQRTDEAPADFQSLMDDTGAPVYALRSRLGIEWDWLDRWQTLSHGERKRAQIGVALWREPSVLAIDEPTNHLDTEAREQLISALAFFKGIGLLVSHDRSMLDELCSQCLWVSASNSRIYPGGYTAMQERRAAEQQFALRTRVKAVRECDALRREASVRREYAQKAHRSRSKRGIANKDHSAKAAVNAAKNTDSKDGQQLRQLRGRMDRAERRTNDTRVEKRISIGIEMPGVICHRDALLQVNGGELRLGDSRVLRFPDLRMRPSDRISLTGGNGLGKSTLLMHLQNHLNVEPERVVFLPQEMLAEQGASILAAVKALPKDELGHAMNVVSSLGSRPEALLESTRPSPGELRKLMLALGMTRRPHLLIMDEPTNHLDLPSMGALEKALAGCRCGMLLVSHDAEFLANLTELNWHLKRDGGGLTACCAMRYRRWPQTPDWHMRSADVGA